eukprot:Skav213762  [mRNA]  locus=scaffold3859:178163:189230:+ [translate_table: standard]
MPQGLVGWEFRAEQMWPLVVGCSVAHRHHFDEFHRVDPVETRAWLQLLSRDDAGTFRTLLNGTFFTSDSAKHWNDGDDTCKFCECSDGRFHRFWQCGLFDAQRLQIPSDVWEMIPVLPETLTCLGWSLRPVTMDAWLCMLAQIPDYDIRRAVLLPAEGINRIYTDGSCFHQHDRVVRHAAWACVLDTGLGFQIIAQGVLPGLLQSAFRAELYAVMIVLEVAAVNHAAVHIYTDNRAVVKGIQRLLRGGRVRPNSPHSDLWLRCFRALQWWQGTSLNIEHVRAHQDRCGGDIDCHGRANSFADRTAVRANLNRNHAFWDFHSHHVQQVHWCRRVSRSVQRALLSVSREVFKTEMVAQSDDVSPPDEPPCQAKQVPSVEFWHTDGELPFKIRTAYGDAFIGRVAAWLGAIRTELALCEEVLPRWVSTFQLYVDFQKACGRGPIRVDGRWDTSETGFPLSPFDFKIHCRWFSRVVHALLKAWGNEVVKEYTRPDSVVLSLHTSCFAVPWPQRRIQAVDHFFSAVLTGAATRDGRTLCQVPPAPLDAGFVVP